MNVVIVTLQHTDNYGAVLQCFALQKQLDKLGYSASVLDLSKLAPLHRGRLKWWQGWGVKSGLKVSSLRARYLRMRFASRVHDKFATFRKIYIKRTLAPTTMAEAEQIITGAHAVVVGSDQVWNQRWIHPVYYLNNIASRSLKLSYSASAGGSRGFEKILGGSLSLFNGIGVRDIPTQSALKSDLGLDSDVVCDPTLLCELSDIEQWSGAHDEKYILAYFLHERSRLLASRVIECLKSTLKLPVYAITVSAHEIFRPDGATVYFNAIGPGEWHYLFKNAAFVCTDSFHGSIFAAKFNKPFIACISDTSTGTRLVDAAERYAFQEAIAKSGDDIADVFTRASRRSGEVTLKAIREHADYSRIWLKDLLRLHKTAV